MKAPFILLFLSLSMKCSGTTFILDSFAEGVTLLSNDMRSDNADVITPLGNRRTVAWNGRGIDLETQFAASINTTSGQLSNSFIGSNPFPFNLQITYSGSGFHSLSSANRFELDISSFSGNGFLFIEIGSGSVYNDSFYSTALTIPLSGPETVTISSDQFNFGTGGSLDSFSATHFVFVSDGEDFSFTLDEIRVVPEPSSALLMLGATAFFGFRRKR